LKSFASWLLGGALAASLTWNVTASRAAEDGRGEAPATVCSTGTGCSPAAAGLELPDEKRAALEALCARSCGASDALEREADALQRRLLASLAADEVDADATARLVDEVSELRRRSLAACVEGILGVRSVLTADEVRALLASCEHSTEAASCR
jgi:hypothetical protein